jgi:DNA-binding YbaB/EbfC family protein
MDLDALMRGFGPLQETLKKAESERSSVSFDGSAGGGAVTVSLSGTLSITKVAIAPAAVTSAGGDVSMLEDLVAVAVNDALKQYQKRFGSSPDDQIQKMLAGSDIGSLMGPLLKGLGH